MSKKLKIILSVLFALFSIVGVILFVFFILHDNHLNAVFSFLIFVGCAGEVLWVYLHE